MWIHCEKETKAKRIEKVNKLFGDSRGVWPPKYISKKVVYNYPLIASSPLTLYLYHIEQQTASGASGIDYRIHQRITELFLLGYITLGVRNVRPENIPRVKVSFPFRNDLQLTHLQVHDRPQGRCHTSQIYRPNNEEA